MSSTKASNDVIRQAQALRQNFKLYFRSNILKQKPLPLNTHEMTFPIFNSPNLKNKGSPHLPRLHISMNYSEKIVKRRVSNLYSLAKKKKIPVSVKSLVVTEEKAKNELFIEKKHKFALYLRLPMPEDGPVSQESNDGISSTVIH